LTHPTAEQVILHKTDYAIKTS